MASPKKINLQNFHWGSFVIGAVVGGISILCNVGVCIGLILYSFLVAPVSYEPVYEELDAWVEVSVESNGCTVTRSDPEGSTDIRELTWVVIDTEGEQVLGRVATDEYEYTYYRPGTYYVHLETWHAGEYVPISDQVRINCP